MSQQEATDNSNRNKNKNNKNKNKKNKKKKQRITVEEKKKIEERRMQIMKNKLESVKSIYAIWDSSDLSNNLKAFTGEEEILEAHNLSEPPLPTQEHIDFVQTNVKNVVSKGIFNSMPTDTQVKF